MDLTYDPNDPVLQKPEAKILNDFFVKTAADEAILRGQMPRVDAVLKQYGVPALVLKRYMDARAELQGRVDFSIGLYRKYVDPAMGTTTPDPLPLPGFALNTGSGLGAADDAAGVAALMALPDAQIVTAADVMVDRTGYSLLQTSSGDSETVAGLGNPALVAWIVYGVVISYVLLAGGVAATIIIKALNNTEAQVAFQATQMKIQENYAAVWNVATQVLNKCIGASPTSAQVTACWNDISARFPELVKSIPKAEAPSNFGFFSKLMLLAGAGAAIYVGVWFFRRHQAKKATGAMERSSRFSHDEEYDIDGDAPERRPSSRTRPSNGSGQRRPSRASQGI